MNCLQLQQFSVNLFSLSIMLNEKRTIMTFEECLTLIKGCQTTGYYGLDCSIPCQNVNCQYCHIKTGTCQGCKPGFKGQGCELGKSRKNIHLL